MVHLSFPGSLGESKDSICQMADEKSISQTGFQTIPFMIGPDEEGRMRYLLGGGPSQDMIMGVVNIDDIKRFFFKVPDEMPEIPEIVHQGRGPEELQDMIQMELAGGWHTRCQDPFLQAVIHAGRRFPKGQRHLVSPLLELLAEIEHGLCRAGPFPVAKKLKNFQWRLLIPPAARPKKE
jgi:hypothetical protein